MRTASSCFSAACSTLQWLVVVALLEAAAAQQWTAAAPLPCGGHALTVDWNSGRTVRFGGGLRAIPSFVPDAVFGDTWELVGASWLPVPGPAPAARSAHAMVFDWARGRTVLFGGADQNGTAMSDTWEYQGGVWTRIATAHAPTARSHHAMAFDGMRSRVVLYGGRGPFGQSVIPFNDTWEFDGTDWMPVFQSGPPRLVDHAMAYDIVRGRTVMFGGEAANLGLSSETWEYDGTRWLQAQSGPSVRSQHAMAYDLLRARTVVFGGMTGNGATQVLEYDGTVWTSAQTPVPPRQSPAMAYDLLRGRMVLDGGFDSPLGAFSDTWEYDGSTWSRIYGDLPPAGGEAAFDPGRDEIVHFGGQASFTPLSETWLFRNGTWQHLATATAPSPRVAPGMAYLAAIDRIVLFGGNAPSTSGPNDTWTFDGVTWQLVATGTAPSPRVGFGMTHDAARRRIVLFGGRGTSLLADTWEFDGRQWTQVATPNVPSPRAYMGLAADPTRGRTVLFGGSDAAGVQGDTWEYDGTTWRIVVGAGPSPRSGPAMIHNPIRGRVVLFGGSGPSIHANDLWEYDGTTWTILGAAQTPLPVGHVVTTYDSNRNKIFQYGLMEAIRDSWLLSWAPNPSWSRYGQGCGGSNGTPSLDNAPGSLPRLGATMQLQLSSLPSSPGFALVLLGLDFATWNGLPLPVPLDGIGLAGCSAWIAPGPVDGLLVAHAGNTASRGLSIPADAALAGLVVGMQTLVLDPALPAGLSTSNAALLLLY